uniref:Transmembrane protein n=1 Tax=Branchiostoma floridae TaxID=7739 RepID=C3YWR9_BRAFL|eukprot:XP_002599301.1 hypothetical protein BRAFLDRAFT_64344 [Branchiostoma floridae]
MRKSSEFPVCLVLAVVTATGGLVCIAVGLAGHFSGSVLLCLVGGHVLFLALGFGLFWYLLNLPSRGQKEDGRIALAFDPCKPQKKDKDNALCAAEPVMLTVGKGDSWAAISNKNDNNNNNNDNNATNNNLVLMETVV